MALKVLMLNPKAVKLFAQPGAWERAGRPTPLVVVTGTNRKVTLSDAISGAHIGSGHLSGNRNHEGHDYFDANTSDGVRPRGVGYGLALYCGLSLLAQQQGAAGVSSPDGGGAVDLWDAMVDSDLAMREEHSDESHEESTTVTVDVALPENSVRRRYGQTNYDDMMSEVREALDIPEHVKDEDIEVEADSTTAEVDVTVRWTDKTEGGYFLPASNVSDSGLVVGGFDSDQRVRLNVKNNVPADLLAAIPVATMRALRTVVHLLKQLGRDTSIEMMLQREDIAAIFQSEGKQMMIPGVPAHYPRPPAEDWKQVPFPGMSGLGGRRGRGLGDLPRGLVISAKAQGILHRFGNID